MLNIDCQILFAIKLPVDNVSRKAGCLSNHFQFSYATLRYYESQGECGLFFPFFLAGLIVFRRLYLHSLSCFSILFIYGLIVSYALPEW